MNNKKKQGVKAKGGRRDQQDFKKGGRAKEAEGQKTKLEEPDEPETSGPSKFKRAVRGHGTLIMDNPNDG